MQAGRPPPQSASSSQRSEQRLPMSSFWMQSALLQSPSPVQGSPTSPVPRVPGRQQMTSSLTTVWQLSAAFEQS